MTDDADGTETFEQGDEAIDEASRLDPDFVEELELDPSLDPSLQADERELEEAGAELDDPEQIAVLDGLIDDPDGLGEPSPHTRAKVTDTAGWDLDSPLTSGPVDDTGEGLTQE